MATMNTGLGGAAGYGEQSFRTSAVTGNLDDGFVNVNVTSVFGAAGMNINGTSYTSMFISSNGLITFVSGVTSYTPTSLTSLGQPSLAPFWTDADINKGGEIYWDLDPTTGKITVTWANVAAFQGPGTNSFQVVITATGGGDFEVEYIYENIGYTNGYTGHATTGLSNGVTQTLLEGSGDPAVLSTYSTNDFDVNTPAGVYGLGFEGGSTFVGDGIVDGTAGNDLINTAYTGDPNGDRVDAADATGFGGTTGDGDYIRAGLGNDTVIAGLGNDVVFGGDGADSIQGGYGADTVDGGIGNDTIDGGSGNDSLEGGAGDDVITGGSAGAAVTYTPTYVEVLGSTAAVAGAGGRPNFSVQSVSNENDLTSSISGTAGNNGTLTGFRIGNGDSNETHTHTASSQIAGGRIQFNGLDTTELATIRIDGVTINLNTAIANGSVTFNGASVYAINAAGQITRAAGSTSANPTTIGTLTINIPYTSLAIVASGTNTTTTSGLFYEYLVNTQPLNIAAEAGGNDTLSGGAGNDVLSGGDGNDVLLGGDNNDQLFGGTGNDNLSGDLGNDTLQGEDGDDTLAGGGGADSLLGGIGNDSLLGDAGADTIAGGDGDDRLFGGADNDSLLGDAGADTLAGGDGDDRLFGGLANDSLSGDAGNDTLQGDDGDDTLAGGDGADSLLGGVGNDSLLGDAGADTLVGGDGNDTLAGGDDNDQLFGGTNNDSLSGDLGNDTLQGEDGDDTLGGGGGADSLLGGVGSDSLLGDAGADTLAGGDGNDRLFGGADNDSLLGEVGADTLAGGDGDDRLFGGADNDSLSGDLGNDSLDGGDGNDTLSGGDGADTLTGGLGNDSLLGDAGADSIAGGDGLDRLFGGADNDSLSGDAGADTLAGGDGDDRLFGGADNDSLTGDLGNDSLEGGDGNDTLSGGDGADTLAGGYGNDSLNAGAGDDTVTDEFTGNTTGGGADTVDLGDGNDVFTGSGQGTGDVDLIFGGLGNDTITVRQAEDTVYGGDGNDLITTLDEDPTFGDALYGDAGNDTIIGANTDDTLFGGIGNDVLSGGANTDTLFGGDGDDTLIGGAGADSLDGGTGRDTADYSASDAAVTVNLAAGTGLGGHAQGDVLSGVDNVIGSSQGDVLTLNNFAGAAFGGGGADTLFGGTGNNDSLFGGDGNDQLSGLAGNDSLDGGANDDVLIAGLGDDTLSGGAGNDTAVFTGPVTDYSFGFAAGNVLIVTDSVAGRDGVDRLDGVEFATFNGVTYRVITGDDGSNTTLQGPNDGTPSLIIAHAGNDWGGGHATSDAVFGGAGNDTLDGGDGNDTLVGEADDDLLRGDGGNDALFGGTGNDTLQGGAGNDSLTGGDGNDVLEGGDGADTQMGGSGDDTIRLTGIGDVVDGGENAGDNDVLDLSNWGWRNTNILYDPGSTQSGTVQFLDSNGAILGSMQFSNFETVIPCFTPGTLITTRRGEVAVECLRAGDEVLTRDHGYRPLVWTGQRSLSAADLIANPQMRPVRIAAGALGNGLPRRDMLVSPQHRMLIEGARAEMLFGEAEVLVAALHLAGSPGIETVFLPGLTYVHIMFEGHEIVCADGAWSESFQPAQRMLGGMEADQADEIRALFPDLAQGGTAFAAARLTLKAYEARVLLAA